MHQVRTNQCGADQWLDAARQTWRCPYPEPRIIVPTRSDFVEGIAKTAVEAILAGRPVITNAGVGALEILRPACIEAQADNPESYAAAVIALRG